MREPAILSRRAAAAFPLAALFGPAAVALPSSAADAELLDLGRQWLALHLAHVEHWRAWQALPEAERHRRNDELSADCLAMSDQESALKDRIHAIPSTTLAGLAVKARVFACDNEIGMDEASIAAAFAAAPYVADRAALSLALDCLRMTRAAS